MKKLRKVFYLFSEETMTQGMQPRKSEVRDGSRKKRKQANVVNKLDNLYRFIRRLGLHYKISENFGSTTITIGRNFHGFNERLDLSSSDDFTESKHAPERDNMLAATKTTLGNMDTLYKFVRGLGLHYRLTENYGSTSITIGRNYHPFAELYEDLSTCENPDMQDLGSFDTENNQKIKTEADLVTATELEAHTHYGDFKTSEKVELEELLSAYEYQNWKIREDLLKVNAEMEALKLTNSDLSTCNSYLIEQERSLLKQEENSKLELSKLSKQYHTLQTSNDLLQQEVDKTHEAADKKSLLLSEENNKLRKDLLSSRRACSELKARNKRVEEELGSREDYHYLRKEVTRLKEQANEQMDYHYLREEVTRLKEQVRKSDVDRRHYDVACEMAKKTQEIYRGMLEEALNGKTSWEAAARDMLKREEKKARPKSFDEPFVESAEESWMDFTHCRQDSKRETWCTDCIDDYAKYWNQGLYYNPTTREWTKRTVRPKDWLGFFHCRGVTEPFDQCGKCNQVSCFWDEDLFWNGNDWVARERSTAQVGSESEIYEYWMGHFHCRQDSKAEDHCMDCAVEFGYYWQHGLYWNGNDWVKRKDAAIEVEPDDPIERMLLMKVESDDFFEFSFDDKCQDAFYEQ